MENISMVSQKVISLMNLYISVIFIIFAKQTSYASLQNRVVLIELKCR